MKIMVIAFAAIIVISVGANLVLENMGFSSAQETAGANVRLGQDVN